MIYEHIIITVTITILLKLGGWHYGTSYCRQLYACILSQLCQKTEMEMPVYAVIYTSKQGLPA